MPAFTDGAGGRNPQAGSGSEPVGGAAGDRTDDAAQALSEAERVLLDAALEFYAAAGAVIEYGAPERPRLRAEAGGLAQVRDAMTALEAQVCQAHAAGVARERIARIARLDEEFVELILARGDAEPAGA